MKGLTPAQRVAAAADRRARLAADVVSVVARTVFGDETFDAVAKEYGVAERDVTDLLIRHTTPAAREAARVRKRLRTTARNLADRLARGVGRELPVGTERVRRRNRRPAVYVKVALTGPDAERWKPRAVATWVAANGPVPRRHFVGHRNGDTFDDRLENLVLVRNRDRLAHGRAVQPGAEGRRVAGVRRAVAARRGPRHHCFGRKAHAVCLSCDHARPGRLVDLGRCEKCGSVRVVGRYLAGPVAEAAIADPLPASAATPVAAADPRVAEHYPAVERWARRAAERMPWSVDADEVVSAAVDGLYAACRTFRVDGGASFRTHLHARVRGAILDWQRAQDWAPRGERARAVAEGLPSPRLLVAADDRLDESPRSDVTAEDVSAAEAWDTLVGVLDGRSRRIVLLYLRDGRTMREVGRAVGVSESRVSHLYAAAVATLQRSPTFRRRIAALTGVPADSLPATGAAA